MAILQVKPAAIMEDAMFNGQSHDESVNPQDFVTYQLPS